MKDLQEVFETMSTIDMKQMVEALDKKSLNPTTMNKIFGYIAQAYIGENNLNVDEVEIDKDELEKLLEAFSLNVALYQNVLSGDMIIKSGRIKLLNGAACKLSLTKKGIRNVENMIKK